MKKPTKNKKQYLAQAILAASLTFSSHAFAVRTIDTSCGIVSTSIMPSGALAHADNANFSSVIGFDYDTRGYKPPASPTPLQIASAPEVGTVWGKAYNSTTQTLYVAAFLRRHAPLSPNGLGAIYAIDVSNTSSAATIGTPTLWMDLNSTTHLGAGATLFPSETDANRGLGSPFSPNNDTWAFDKVARQGIGGLTLSDDFSTMYAMDLTNRQLLVIDVATKTVTTRQPITNANCADPNDIRPFGVDVLNGSVYVGVSCSAETAQNGGGNATAHVMRLNGNSFVEVVTGSLKGYRWSHYWDLDANAVNCDAPDRGAYVPLITNMALDSNGNMLIGVTGVNGWRYANRNYAPNPSCSSLIGEHAARGFVLHATPNGNNWAVAATEEHDSGAYTHHYKDGQYVHWSPGGSHTYQSGMGITDCSGQEVVIVNVMDPLNHESGGTRWMRTSDAQQEAYEATDTVTIGDKSVAEQSTLEHYQGIGDTWEKSAGLGDIEYLRTSTTPPTPPPPAGCTTVTNTATVTATETDTDPSNNSASANVQVNCDNPTNPQMDLRLVKRADKTQVRQGGEVVFTLELTNEGAATATHIQVSDVLPNNVTYQAPAVASQGSYDNTTGIWAVGDLTAGQTETLIITVSVNP
ncbi:MAG: DUF11 domain-containing protein [bacterium]